MGQPALEKKAVTELAHSVGLSPGNVVELAVAINKQLARLTLLWEAELEDVIDGRASAEQQKADAGRS